LAFIVPLLIATYLLDPEGVARINLFPGLDGLLRESRETKFLWGTIFVLGVITLGGNSANPIIVIVTALPNAIFLYLGKRVLFKKSSELPEMSGAGNVSIEETEVFQVLRLRGKAFTIVSIYLGFLYLAGFLVLFPKQIPGPITIGVTLVSYLIVVWALRTIKSPAIEEYTTDDKPWLKWYLYLIVLAALLSVIPPLIFILFIFAILFEIPVSIIVAYLILNNKFS
jgi:hypothetical protein